MARRRSTWAAWRSISKLARHRFWPALHRAGFTPRQLSPFEDVELPRFGLQDETLGDTRIWVPPNPSGLNANDRPADLVNLYAQLKQAQ